MYKGKKKVGRVLLGIVSCIVLCAIFLPVLAAMLLSLPSIQTRVSVAVARLASRYAETEVSIGTLSVDRLSRIEITDLFVRDYYGDTVLFASRASALIDRHELLFNGTLKVGNIVTDSLYLSIFKPEDWRDNLSQIFDRVNEKMGQPESKPFEVNGITVHHSTFAYRDELARPVRNGIDYTNMYFTNIEASSHTLLLDGNRLECELHGVSGRERSGVVIDAMSTARMVVDEGLLEFSNAVVFTGGAMVNMPSLLMNAKSWDSYRSFVDSVDMHVELRNSRLNFAALRGFVDGVPELDLPLSALTATYDGILNDFDLNVASLTVADSSSVSLSGTVADVTDPNRTRFDLPTLNIRTNANEIIAIYDRLSTRPLPDSVASTLSRLGNLWVGGTLNGRIDDIDADLVTVAAVGRIDVDGVVQGLGSKDISFAGEITASDLNLGDMIANNDFGKAAFTLNGDVALVEGKAEGNAALHLIRLQYLGYNYSGIDVDAAITAGEDVRLSAVSTDPSLRVSTDVNCNFAESRYNMILDVQGIDFQRLGFNRDRSWLSCNLEASGSGFAIDDIEFKSMISNLVYISPTDTLSTDIANIVAGNSEGHRSLSIYSSIFDAEYRSTESYADVFRFLSRDLPSEFPTVADKVFVPANAASPANTTLTINLKSENIAQNFVDGLRLSAESRLYLALNPTAGGYSLSVESGFAEWGDYLASNVNLSSDNFGGSPRLRVDLDELFALGTRIPEITFDGSTNGHALDLSLIFGNPSSPLFGRLAVNASVGRDSSGAITATGSITDSYVADRNQRWLIDATDIEARNGVYSIGSFRASCGDQSLTIAGEISDRPFSSLEVKIDNIDLYAPMQIALNKAVDIHGRLDGYARFGSVLRDPTGGCGITLSDVDIDGAAINSLQLSASMASAHLIDFSVRNTLSDSVLLSGNYSLGDNNYQANVDIADLDISVFNPLLGEVLTDSEGTASVDLTVKGSGSRPSIFGTIGVNGLITKVVPTGVTYRIEPVRLVFSGDSATLARTEVVDLNNSRATVEASLNLKDLSKIGYEVKVLPNDFMVLDTGSESGSSLYGKLFVSGAVNLHGTPAANIIDAAIRTGNGSSVTLLLNGTTDFASADYIHFVNTDFAAAAVDTTDVIELKRLQFDLKNELSRRKKRTEIAAALQVGTDTELRLLLDPATDNLITARGTADLNVTLDSQKNDMQIRGDYRITEGNYRFNFENIISKDFTINPGSYIRWNGGLLDADIDLTAVYRLKTSLAPLLGTTEGARSMTPVDCIINLKNRLSAIDISFGINVPNANTEYQSILSSYFASQEMMATQFVYLLALGTFYAEDNTAAQTTSLGTTAGSAIGLGFLTAQVSRLLSTDSYQFNVKYNQQSGEYSSSGYGVDFQTELIDDRLLLELEANVDTGETSATTNMNPVSGGGSLTLLLDKAGNLIMKGFSRTIDRFDENQGLQESGVGVYYGRSFDRFGDLFRKKGDKKGSPTPNKQKK